jgi:hypothetical protein
VREGAAPAFGGLGPGFSHGAKPKPPPVRVAQPSPAASAGGVSPPVPSPGGTPGQPAGGTPALQGSCRTMPRRRRWSALN